MLQCPECALKLRKQNAHRGFSYWGCPNCGGHYIGIYPLKKLIGEAAAQKIWMQSAVAETGRRPCPACTKSMRVLLHEHGTVGVELDVCRPCQIVWTDQGELANFENLKESREKVHLTQEEMKTYTQAVLEMSREGEEQLISHSGPQESWKYVPAIVGLPVEFRSKVLRYTPFLTWALCLVTCLVVFRTAFSDLDYYLQTYGFKPSEPLRFFGLTLITSFFLHGGLLHLLGNVYYLLIFGDDAEDDLGQIPFLGLVFGSHWSGLLAHILVHGSQETPLVGASAGVFGVLAFYAVRFSRRKVGYAFFLPFRPLIWLRISVKWLFIGKILWEVFAVAVEAKDGIAHAAHAGGAIFGALLGYFSFPERREEKAFLP